jgi:hypothetical protein
MERRGATKSKINYDKPEDDKVIISSKYLMDERPSFICSICNRTLTRLTDGSLQNSSFWCRNCSVEFDPGSENVRRQSKLSVSDRNEEPLVAHPPGQDYLSKKVEIHKEPEIKGGLKALRERGMKITYHDEHIPE